MQGYGQFCPIARAAEVFCERWVPLIIRELARGRPLTQAEIQRGVPQVSSTWLTRKLEALAIQSIVDVEAGAKEPRYSLGEAGQDLVPLIDGLAVWGKRWARQDLREDEADPELLIWALEGTVDPNAFDDRRCLVRLDFPEQGPGHRTCWLRNRNGRVKRLEGRGTRSPDLHISSSVKNMIRVYRGDLSVFDALEEGRLELDGEPWAVGNFEAWLNLPAVTRIQPVRRGQNTPAEGA